MKRIAFTETEWDNVYNLVFGDVDNSGEINDQSVSDNGDRNKILATIVKTVGDYTQKYPDRWIFFCGSTNERTRLYRMAEIKSDLFQRETTYTVSEELNKLKGKVLAPKKLAEANELLRKLKTPLPK